MASPIVDKSDRCYECNFVNSYFSLTLDVLFLQLEIFYQANIIYHRSRDIRLLRYNVSTVCILICCVQVWILIRTMNPSNYATAVNGGRYVVLLRMIHRGTAVCTPITGSDVS